MELNQVSYFINLAETLNFTAAARLSGVSQPSLTRAIRRGDGEALFDHFTRTRAIRRGIVETGQDSAAPDFGRPHANLQK